MWDCVFLLPLFPPPSLISHMHTLNCTNIHNLQLSLAAFFTLCTCQDSTLVLSSSLLFFNVFTCDVVASQVSHFYLSLALVIRFIPESSSVLIMQKGTTAFCVESLEASAVNWSFILKSTVLKSGTLGYIYFSVANEKCNPPRNGF